MADALHVSGAGTVVGDVLDGHRITHRFRVRGCTAVYQAVERDRTLVLKTLCRGAGPRAQAGMDNELAALRALRRCPDTPELVRAGESGPQRYLAMTWHPGSSLRRLGTTGGRDAVEEFARWAVPVVETYARLHAAGVVHGDVSRHNILVDERHGPTLIDFESAARATEPDPPDLHRRLTWAYAAPELATGGPTPASDQYAVAAVLYRQLTGRRPRPEVRDATSDSRPALRLPARRLTGPAARRWPGLPAVLAKALRQRPGGRYEDMATFAAALRDCST